MSRDAGDHFDRPTGTRSTVSVIIPSQDSIRTIGHCLAALAQQSYAPFEIIVVDDGSIDDSPRVAAAMGAVVRYTGVASGQSVARNLGAEHARGEILFFLDSDVALAPDAIALAVEGLRSDAELGAICGVYDHEPLLPTTAAGHFRTVQQYVWFNEVDGTVPGLHTAMFAVRAEVFREIGPFNTGLRYAEDQEYGYRLHQRYDVRASLAIRGKHDHDAALSTILRKVYHRARQGMPLWLRYRTLPGGAGSGPRAVASAVLLAGVVAVPLPLLLGPASAAVAPTLVAVGVLLDLPMYRYAVRSRGVRFGIYFGAVQLLVNVVAATAAGVGVLQYLASLRGRADTGADANERPASSPGSRAVPDDPPREASPG